MPFWVADPVTATATVDASPASTPQAPPTAVAVTLIESGKVRAVPLTVVSVTTGSVWSTLTTLAPVVPELAAVSVWVAVIV